jgi:hypothetical protein
MFKLNKKIPIVLLCFALLGFAFLSLGGDFLHSQIHDHEQGTEKECPLYQFLLQALISIIVAIVALKIKVQRHVTNVIESILSWVDFSIPPPRGPPSLL